MVAILGKAPVVHGDDVGVGEGGGALGLPLEPLDELLVLGQVPREDLDRNVAA